MTEFVRPVDFELCVDLKFVKSSVALGFIPDVDDRYLLIDDWVLLFLNSRSQRYRNTVALPGKIVRDFTGQCYNDIFPSMNKVETLLNMLGFIQRTSLITTFFPRSFSLCMCVSFYAAVRVF